MNAMLKKDVYTIQGLLPQYIVFFIMAVALSIMLDSPIIGTGILIMYGSNMLISLFFYDEKCHWEEYASVMPVSRRETVKARYTLGALLILACMVVAIALGIATTLIAGSFTGEMLWMLLCSAALLGGMAYGSMACLMPLTYRFGSEKARMLNLLSYGLLFAVLFGAILFFAKAAPAITPAAISIACACFLFAALCALLPSYKASVRFYETKEF